MDWSYCKQVFEGDTLLRDIYVLDTTVEEWDAFLTFVRNSDYSTKCQHDNNEVPFPKNVAVVFGENPCSHHLSIDVEGVLVACHFFSLREIELDIVASEVQSQESLDSVLRFMRELGDHLSRDVILTEESMSELVWFMYRAKLGQFLFVGTD